MVNGYLQGEKVHIFQLPNAFNLKSLNKCRYSHLVLKAQGLVVAGKNGLYQSLKYLYQT